MFNVLLPSTLVDYLGIGQPKKTCAKTQVKHLVLNAVPDFGYTMTSIIPYTH